MLVDPFEWKRRAIMNGCQIHDNPEDCEPPLQACHIISQMTLKRHGLRAYLWDTRNSLGACYRAHRRSDQAHQRFPRDRIPQCAEDFAEEHGLGWKLDKLYPKNPLSGDTFDPGAAA